PAEAAKILRESRLGKIPVWHGTADNIAGLVYAKDVLLNPSRPLAEALHSVWYVPETKRLDSLLRDFRRLKIQLAIAVDEYGGTAGLVTVEDCMGRIVGQADGGAEARGDA
ncbi:MAG: hypothetical protein QF662_06695, partial [Phycisphaerae bacterium]|nr:hypothetical protein [Phycisphaerae bacterium]